MVDSHPTSHVRVSTSLLLGAAASWGLGAVLSKYALGGFPPAVLLPLQLLCSVVLLGGLLLFAREPVSSVQQRGRIALLGVLNPGVAYALGLLGLSSIQASTSVVIWATEPVLIVVMAFAILREPLSSWAVGCLAAAMLGIGLIVGTPSAANTVVGVVLTLVSVIACALYTIILRRMSLTDGTLPTVWIQQVSALAFAGVVVLMWSLSNENSIDPSVGETLAAVASGATYYGLGFLLYVGGLRRTSAARAGISLTLIPVFGLLFSALLLGERFTAVQAAGGATVIAAMAVLAIVDARTSSRSSRVAAAA